MRHQRLLAVCLAALLCAVSQACAIEFDPNTMLRTAEIRAGMTGVCKTVLKGTTIEEFPVEIIGVLEKTWNGGDIILFRITGGPLFEKKIGILSGMSGSPVYINGKLAGAISLSFDVMMREPMGGATPIEQMIQPSAAPALPQQATLLKAPRPLMLAGRPVTQFLLAPLGSPVKPTHSTPVLRPVATPLFVSGVRPEQLAALRPLVESYGFRLYPGPGQSSTPVQAPLEPGAALGVAFCLGDISAASVGTVTYRQGDEVLAFGHPMMGTGPCGLPMTAAWVHGYVESSWDPFKLSSPAQIVGTLTGDHAWSIAGRLDLQPPTMPVNLAVSNAETGVSKHFAVEVCQDKTLTPLGLLIALQEAASGVGRQAGATTWVSKIALRAQGLEPIRRRVAFSTGSFGLFSFPAAYQLTGVVMEMLMLLASNPWETPDILSMELETEMVDQDRASTIVRAETDRLIYRPGETVKVAVVVQPLNGKRYVETFSLPLPKELPDGPGSVLVFGGMFGPYLGGDGLLPPAIDDLPGFLDWYQTLDAENDLVAVIAYPTAGVTFPEGQLKDLPEHVLNLLEASGRQDQVPGMQWDKTVRHLDRVVYGMDVVEFTVERERWGAPGERPEEHAPPMRHEGPPVPQAGAMPPAESLWLWPQPRTWAEQILRPQAGLGPYPPPGRQYGAPSPPLTFAPNLLPRQDELPPEVKRELERRGVPKELLEKAAEEEEAPPPEEEGEEKAEEEEEAAEPVTRQAMLHGWTTGEDFAKFRFAGAAPTPDGRITLLPSASPALAGEIPETIIWCAAACEEGTVYVGTGHKGRVYKVPAGGQPELLLNTKELEVTALALGADGTLYVGTGPEGRVYAVTKEGESRLLLDAQERYIWSLLSRPDGSLLAAVGGPAACVYRISPDGAAQVFLQPPDCRHALALAAEGDIIYVGTGEEGRLYRCPPDSAPRIVFEPKAHGDASDLVAILPTRVGVIVGTSDGQLRAIKPSGLVVDITVPEDAEELSLGVLLPAAKDDPAEPIALIGTTESDGALYVLFSLDFAPALVKRFPGHQFTAAARSPSGQAFLCSSNPCAVFSLPTAAPRQTGQALSPAYDMERFSHLGRVFWRATVPEGAHLWVESRSGNTLEPDQSWSAWSSGHVFASGEKLTSPPGRYAQFRLNLRASEKGEAPSVDQLYFIYMPANRAPKVSFSEPKMIAFWKEEKEISWEGEDPDDDALTYDLFVSSDNGATWKPLEQGLKETTYTWKTKDEKDGIYRLKIVASDARANAQEAHTAEALSCAVYIDNTPPRLTKRQTKHELDEENRLHVRGSAIDRESDIAGVEYCIDDGDPISAQADDGIFDSIYERFSFLTEPLKPGTHAVKITAYDEPRNTTSYTIEEIEVAGEEEEAAVEEEGAAVEEEGAAAEQEAPGEEMEMALPEQGDMGAPEGEAEGAEPLPVNDEAVSGE